MSRKLIAATLAALLFVPAALQADPATQAQKSAEDVKLKVIENLERQNAALKKEIQRLGNQVANLQDQLEANTLRRWQLEVKPLVPKEPMRIVPVPTEPKTITPPSLQTLPPGTIEKKINGETFYVIPVSGNVSAGAARRTGVSPVLVAPEKK